jgi:hypothetical protein
MGRSKFSSAFMVLLVLFLSLPFGLKLSSAASSSFLPSQAATSDSDSAIGFLPQQYRTFYASSRYWVFFEKNNFTTGTANISYCTSTDGLTWSNPMSIRSDPYDTTYGWSICFDGTDLHYVLSNETNAFYYRMGTPNSDGTISWLAREQTIVCGGFNSTQYTFWDWPVIVTDSNGYPIVSCINDTDSSPWVIKSSTRNGTWTMANGFPFQLDVYRAYWVVGIVPLANGKFYCTWCSQDRRPVGEIFGSLYDGTTWHSIEDTGALSNSVQSFPAQAYGDNILLVTEDGTYTKSHWRDYDTGWQTSQTVCNADEYTTLSVDKNTGIFYCFWFNVTSYHIYYKKCAGGAWDPTSTEWISQTYPYTHQGSILAFDKAYGSTIGLAYQTGSTSPYNIWFDLLPTSTSTTASATTTAATSTSTTSTSTTSSKSASTSYATSTTLEAVTPNIDTAILIFVILLIFAVALMLMFLMRRKAQTNAGSSVSLAYPRHSNHVNSCSRRC